MNRIMKRDEWKFFLKLYLKTGGSRLRTPAFFLCKKIWKKYFQKNICLGDIVNVNFISLAIIWEVFFFKIMEFILNSKKLCKNIFSELKILLKRFSFRNFNKIISNFIDSIILSYLEILISFIFRIPGIPNLKRGLEFKWNII